MKPWLLFVALLVVGTSNLIADDGWISIAAETGPGAGKHIVFITGDEEYRSEEGMPQIAKILAKHHGFRCTVLFSIDQETGCIDPQVNDNIPGLEALDDADPSLRRSRCSERIRMTSDFLMIGP